MKPSIFLKDHKGFTLIEVLVSISLLGIISVSILSFYNQSYDYTKKNQSKTVGINVARNVVNYIEQQDFSLLSSYISSGPVTITRSNCSNPDGKGGPGLPSCSNVFESRVNNVVYQSSVTLSAYEAETDGQNEEYTLSDHLIPVIVKVTWNGNETEVKGIIKK